MSRYLDLVKHVFEVDESTQYLSTHSGMLIRTKDRDIKIVDTLGPDDLGKFLGFPDCCIKAFLKQMNEMRPPSHERLKGTGYVACSDCVDKYTDMELMSKITVNRLCPTPFPDESGIYGAEYLGFLTERLLSAEVVDVLLDDNRPSNVNAATLDNLFDEVSIVDSNA